MSTTPMQLIQSHLKESDHIRERLQSEHVLYIFPHLIKTRKVAFYGKHELLRDSECDLSKRRLLSADRKEHTPSKLFIEGGTIYSENKKGKFFCLKKSLCITR